MSTEIDERVVEMTFDNKRFERNAEQSISTLGKLKQALKLDKAVDSLETVDKTAKKLDFSSLVGAVEMAGEKFSALRVIGVTALANITNSAVNAGKQLVKSLSVDQISAGWEKFGSKTSSVATLVSQGYELETVNEQLSRLNWFTDETSYNFTDMVANIAKFTATGQDLKASVTAMEGIANWAALSGQNASTASNAMYQLSQAMGAGVMRKEDYKSIQNASMDTDEFRQKCLDAGVALKTLKKNADGTYTSLVNNQGAFEKTQFAEHLTQDAWFTSDVMMKVFGDYSAAVDQIYDYADEKGITASQAIEELGDKVDEFGLKAFRAAQEARTWGDAVDSVKDAVSTGWMNTFEILFGNQKEATELWTDLANALYDVFAAGGEARNEVLSGWKELGGRNDLIEAFWNTWEAVGAVIAPVKEAFRDIFPPVTAEMLAKLTKQLKDFTAKLKISEENAEKIRAVFKGVFSVLSLVLKAIKGLISGTVMIIKNFSGAVNVILGAAAAVGKWLTVLHDAVKQNDIFAKALYNSADIVKKFVCKVHELRTALTSRFETSDFSALGNMLGVLYSMTVKLGKAVLALGKQLGSAISKAFSTGGIKGVIDIINGGIFAGILLNARKFTKGFSDAFGGINDILGGVTGILDGVKGCLSAWQEQLKAGTLLKIAKAIAILAVSLAVMAMIDEDRLTNALVGLTVLFTELMASLAVFGKMNLQMTHTTKAVTAMVGMSAAILILSAALKNISSLDWDELTRSLSGVAVLCAELLISAKALSKINGMAIKGATGLIVLAAALKIMASVCTDLSKLSWEELAKGLAGVGVLLAEVDIFLNTAKFGKRAVSTAVGITITATAIKILALAVKDFSSMNWESIGKGLAGIAGVLAEITLFVNLAGDARNVVATGIALTAIAGAMKIFASVFKDLSTLSWEGIAKGLTSTAGALAAIVVAVKLLPKDLIAIGTGLVVVGAAVTVLTNCMKDLGKMSWENIAKGIAAVGGSLLIFAGGLNLMKKTAGASASLILASVGLGLLVPELKALGKMNIGQIGTSLLALAGAFAVVGVSASLLRPLVGTIIKVSAAMTLFGVGTALAGAGLLAASVGITALSASLVVAASSLGEIITALCRSITSSAEEIGKALTAITVAVCNSLRDTIPLIADTLVEVSVEALSSLKGHLPQIVDLLFDILSTLLDKLELRLPELAKKAVSTLEVFFAALDEVLGIGGIERMMTSITAVAGTFLALAAAAKLISSIDTAGVLKGIAGFAAVVGAMVALLAALGGIHRIPGIDYVLDEGAKVFSKIGSAIGAFIGNMINGLISAMPADISQVLTAISSIELIALAFKPLMEIFGDSDFVGAVKTVGIVGVAVSGLAALLTLMGGLAQIPGCSWLIDEGGKLLAKIGSIIGCFIGSIIDGLASSISSQLDNVIKGLLSVVGVVAAVAKISDIIEKVSLKGMVEGIAGVAVAILGITAILSALGGLSMIPGFADIMSGGTDILLKLGTIIGQFVGNLASGLGAGITSGLPVIGDNLSAFMTSVTPFIDGVKSVDKNVIEGVLALAGAMLVLTASELIRGMAAFVGGKVSIADFGKDIAELGPSLVAFSDSVTSLNSENVKNAAEAARALAEMTRVIPNEGGVASWFAGENSISKFGSDIVALGIGLRNFSYEVADISPENIKAASEAGKALAEMTSTVPSEQGVAQWFAGNKSISKFGRELTALGIGLRNFSYEVADISPENIKAASEAGKALAEMVTFVPDQINVVIFGDALDAIAEYSIKFSDTLNGVNISAATSSVRKILDLSSSIQNDDLKGLNAFANTLARAAENGVKDFSNTFSGDDAAHSVQMSISAMMNRAGEAIIANAETISNAFREAFDKAAEAVKANTDSFRNLGKNMVCGFVDGIRRYISEAQRAAREMASAAADAARDELDIHSPSKVFHSIGTFAGRGFVEALSDYSDSSYSAGANIGNAAKSGINAAIGRVADIVNGDVDISPMIRPVLDLSDISDNAGKIDALLSREQAVGIETGITALHRRTQTPDDIASGKLGGNITFTQNITSPRALDAKTIYRQTRNQFSRMKEVLGT